ncbi:MAG TPA: hypothetical protein VGD01_18190 [Candidatus Elarobacter sp.]|jgi:hypothetical protein
MNDRTNSDEGATDEPALTQRNTETIRGEETLVGEGSTESNLGGDSGTRPRAVPSSYGAAGGTTDATEEGGDGTGI